MHIYSSDGTFSRVSMLRIAALVSGMAMLRQLIQEDPFVIYNLKVKVLQNYEIR